MCFGANFKRGAKPLSIVLSAFSLNGSPKRFGPCAEIAVDPLFFDERPEIEESMEARPEPDHYERGMEGEAYAVAYLRQEGYEILCRNFRHQKAEVDILARRGTLLVVVEVKTRTDHFYEALSDTVSRRKIARLVKAADYFVRERGLEVEVRFDIIQLTGTPGKYTLTHWEDAFYYF